jgi:hypothetical protein
MHSVRGETVTTGGETQGSGTGTDAGESWVLDGDGTGGVVVWTVAVGSTGTGGVATSDSVTVDGVVREDSKVEVFGG